MITGVDLRPPLLGDTRTDVQRPYLKSNVTGLALSFIYSTLILRSKTLPIITHS